MMSRTNKTRLFIYLAIFILVMLVGTFGFRHQWLAGLTPEHLLFSSDYAYAS
jgi:hypothetical protein